MTPAPRLSVAPMMDWTDRHFRYLLRLISRHSLLYSEMIHVNALRFGDRDRHLDFSQEEHPVALQLGGDDPDGLAHGAALAQQWGYDEVNLNVGCPSKRVQNGSFGACLMAAPERVRELVEAMRSATSLPVTVKHRIGIDELDDYDDLANFVAVVRVAQPERFTIHARKAWLDGLSPKQNREVPPLRYGLVHRLKRDFPGLQIEINGGVRSYEEALGHLGHVDAVMVGRKVCEEPYWLAEADSLLFGDASPVPSRGEVVEAMIGYAERQLQTGVPLKRVSRHLLNLFNGEPGAKAWRRALSEQSHIPGAGPEVIANALTLLPAAVRDFRPATGLESAKRNDERVLAA